MGGGYSMGTGGFGNTGGFSGSYGGYGSYGGSRGGFATGLGQFRQREGATQTPTTPSLDWGPLEPTPPGAGPESPPPSEGGLESLPFGGDDYYWYWQEGLSRWDLEAMDEWW